ncbi:TetR/AcrR family transcriptional regulator [Amphritea atlantica]|uniref:TetR/AcrR family transcriptional regulator n=1 Tax=Amphritea atlantica TaxID=355243 RepID=A0ABY5GS48_9GAMM|nr:TetR/AcrR family transcriptional regulator [Amphritea atlantica]
MTTQKLSREEWINAATQVLATSGIDQVRVDKLAKQLKITRGSFYHHFTSRNDLLVSILDKWRLRATEAVIARIQSGSNDPVEQITTLMNLPITGKRSFEGASVEISIRAWARRDKLARSAVEEVDKYRLSFINSIFTNLGHTSDRAEDLANLVYSYIVAMSLIHFDNKFEERREMSRRLAEFLSDNCPLMKCPKRKNQPE